MADQPIIPYKAVVPVSVDLLFHDPNNPRLPSKIKFKGNDDGEVIQWMLRDASILELMGAIAQVGFFPGEPLLVVACDPDKPEGPFYVVEGNRRLTAVKLLLNPDRAKIYKGVVAEISANAVDKEKLRMLPVIVYEQRREILDYLGYRHVTGIKEWGPHEKTEYLYQLANSSPYEEMEVTERHKALARAIGSKADYVARLLTGRELFKRAEDEQMLNDDSISRAQDSFTALTTALYYKNIAAYIHVDPKDVSLQGLDASKYNQLLGWLYTKGENGKTVVGETRNLKFLNEVVANADAVKYLEQHNDLAVAFQMATTNDPIENFRNQLNRIATALQTAIDLAVITQGLTTTEWNIAMHLEDEASKLKRRIKESIES